MGLTASPDVIVEAVGMMDDGDAPDEAMTLIRGTAAPRGTAPWTCPDCSETLEGQFDTCWRCGAASATAQD